MATFSTTAQDTSLYKKYFFAHGKDTLPYRLLLPAHYDGSKQYPLVIVLHGAGERGSDNARQLKNGGMLFAREDIRRQFPAIVVFPQCSLSSFWSNVHFGFDTAARKPLFMFQAGGAPMVSMALAIGLVNQLLQQYPVDKSRVYAGGLSMGGMGVFEMVRRMPGVFAAAFPICGGGNTQTANQMTATAWWIFHGAKDPLVPVMLSEEITKALKDVRAKEVKLTVYPNVAHNSWENAFAEPGLLPWLFQHKLEQTTSE